jgi:hypothetical protein
MEPVQVLHFVTLERCTGLRSGKFELPALVRIRNKDPDLGVKNELKLTDLGVKNELKLKKLFGT